MAESDLAQDRNRVDCRPVGGERTRVRDHIVSALYADLVGPFEGAQAHLTSRELLRQRPSAWYLTGFLVPEGNQESEEGDDELGVGDDVEADEAESEEQEPKQRKTFPASMGFSVLLPPADRLDSVEVTVSFARYAPEWIKEEGKQGPGRLHWRRALYGPKTVKVPLNPAIIARGIEIPETVGARLIGRLGTIEDGNRVGVETGTQALSLFLVNSQTLDENDKRDEYTFFQVQMELRASEPLVPRPNRLGERSLVDLDARISELQYRERVEYAVGHNVAVAPVYDEDNQVRAVCTRWLPAAEVSLVDARQLDGVELSMEKLAELSDGSRVRVALERLPAAYREWIHQVNTVEVGSKDRTETKSHLMKEAELACRRIEEGIRVLEESPEALQAFRIANEAMALASRKRTA